MIMPEPTWACNLSGLVYSVERETGSQWHVAQVPIRPFRWHWRALVLWAQPVRVEDVQVWLN